MLLNIIYENEIYGYKFDFFFFDVVTLTVLDKSPQMITVAIESIRGETFLCSCVYASNFRNDRMILWNEIRQNRELFGSGWVVMGDFNEVLGSNEHSQVYQRLGDQADMRDFQQLIADCELSDLGCTGSGGIIERAILLGRNLIE